MTVKEKILSVVNSLDDDVLDGEPISLADYQGKVLIVDFWGTWCPPCLREIPHFVKLHAAYKDQGLEIVGVNYERGDPDGFAEKIKSAIQQRGITYSCAIGDRPTREQVPNLNAFPTTLFIDPSGTVRLKVVGYHDYEFLETIVKELLSETS